MRPYVTLLSLVIFAACESAALVSGDSDILQTSAGQALRSVVSPSDRPNLYVFQGGPQGTTQPAPTGLTLFIRHLGLDFLLQRPALPSPVLAQVGAASSLPLIGATGTPSSLGSFATWQDDTFGVWLDSAPLAAQGLFPFSQAYCRQVGLGGPQFTLAAEVTSRQFFPWREPGAKLALAADLELPTSRLVVRTRAGALVARDRLDADQRAPIFQSSFFVYLQDTSATPTKVIAVLFNLYDPRGPYELGIGDDHSVSFFTASIGQRSPAGVDLTQLFTVERGAHEAGPWTGYRTFRVSISAAQLRALIARFPSQGLSDDVTRYRLESVGLLNELNFLYADANDCLPDFDSNTSAAVGLSLRRFTAEIVPPEPEARGYFDYVNADGVAVGWACRAGSPAPVTVRLRAAGGAVVTTALADAATEPGVRAACGTGATRARHRFAVALTPQQRAAFQGQLLEAEVVDAAGHTALVLRKSPGASYVVPRGSPYAGYFDFVDADGLAVGWACARSSPAPVAVRLVSARTGEVVASALADAASTDEAAVRAACGTQATAARHRFRVQLSDAQRRRFAGHRLRAEGVDSGFPLPEGAGASYVVPPPPTYAGYFDFVRPDGVAVGWACAQGHVAPVSVRLRTAAGQAVADVVADAWSEEAVRVACGTEGTGASHRFAFTLPPDVRARFAGQSLTGEVLSRAGEPARPLLRNESAPQAYVVPR